MLLTLSQPAQPSLNPRNTHDFTPKYPHFRARLSPPVKAEQPVITQQAGLCLPSSKPTVDMSTQHRGLPPPSSILPEPTRHAPPMVSTPQATGAGHMPAPPMQWQGHESSMRDWLVAKAEEDKRRQEEEKTRQETLKLEQRRIEQAILRESLAGGVPPQMVPMIYAGVGGAGFAQLSLDWLHQYATQLQMAQQQLAPTSPHQAQRMLSHSTYQAPAAGQQANTYSAEVMAQQHAVGQIPAYNGPSRTAPTSAPRSIAQAQLPRLTTNEAFVQQPPPHTNPSSAHPVLQQAHPQEAASSPNIYFHHWVPPSDSRQPQTPATKREDEPTSAVPGSRLSDGEYRDSPRKRKAHGGHQPNPPPSTAPAPYGSPSFSTTSSGSSKPVHGHRRNRSTASFLDESRPDSRREEMNSRLSQQFHPISIREEDERPRSASRERGAVSTVPGAEREQGRKNGHSRGDSARVISLPPADRASGHSDRPLS